MKKTLLVATSSAVMILATPVLAQETTGEPTLIDQMVTAVAGIVVVAIGTIGTLLINRLATWMKGRLDDQAADRIKAALDRAVAVAQAATMAGASAGASYLKTHLADSIKRLKLSDVQLESLVNAEMKKVEKKS